MIHIYLILTVEVEAAVEATKGTAANTLSSSLSKLADPSYYVNRSPS